MKKLAKKIKKGVIKQLENDIRESIIEKIYGSDSKKQLKKLRKKLYKEIQEEIFGEVEETEIELEDLNGESGDNKKLLFDAANNNLQVEVEKTESRLKEVPEKGRILDYRGFKFDVDRMSEIVTGKKRNKDHVNADINSNTESKTPDSVKPVVKRSLFPNTLESALERSYSEKANDKISNEEIKKNDKLSIIEKIQRGDKKDEIRKHNEAPDFQHQPLPNKVQGFNVGPKKPSTPIPSQFPFPSFPVPSNKNFVKNSHIGLTPARKEEIHFFVEKLKDGIDKLGKGEKNINYRKKKDDNYVFTYEKEKNGISDFSLKFDLDLNIYTYGATINKFEFNVAGFKFDESFVEILDIIAVLDTVGMSLTKYIDEISKINKPSKKRIGVLNQKKPKSKDAFLSFSDGKITKPIRANTKVETFIDDSRIVKILNNNDVSNYRDLSRYDDFTKIKGVGAKTADKIQEYIDSYTIIKLKK